MLVFVPALRPGAKILLWCYGTLIAWFFLARTKTLTWRTVALTFSVACVWAWVILGTELVISKATGIDVTKQAAAIVIAGPVEEVLKY